MSIFSVNITGDATAYEVYGGSTAATHYLGAKMTDGAIAWRGLTADDQARTLIEATRFIDAQLWQGLATGLAGGTATTLQWPRSGVTDASGASVDSTVVPGNVVNACFELAALIADDPGVLEQVDAGTNLQSAKAGSAGVTQFVPTSAQRGTAPLFPMAVQRLIAQYLSASAASTSGFTTGADGVSAFDIDDDDGDDIDPFGRSWPL